MRYHGYITRCDRIAFRTSKFDELKGLKEQKEAVEILCELGFEILNPNLSSLLNYCIENTTYRRGASMEQAPDVLDCSLLVKWVYSRFGIWLPRRSIQQLQLGEVVAKEGTKKGDVVFKSGRIDYYYDDPNKGVGHVGLVTGDGSIVHAAGSDVGVAEDSLSEFTTTENLRGIRRYIPKDEEILIIDTSNQSREVETEEDILWIVAQNL
ncbi:MAG: C40 family peptidase [Candidatus Paceibacteria bacterium]